MLRQPADYTGNNIGMAQLRADQGIMGTARARPPSPPLVTDNPMRLA